MFRKPDDSHWQSSAEWALLAFMAGMVNVGGLLSCHRFVTHVTGFATLFGVAAVAGQTIDAIGMLAVPVFFLGGVVVAGVLLEYPVQRGLAPRYVAATSLIAAALLLTTILGQLDVFGPFGGSVQIGRDFWLMALLCGVSGLQNAVISISSGTRVRVTHLTGLTTDLGNGLVRLWGSRDPKTRRLERSFLVVRLGTISAFGAGGVLGALLFRELRYLGFLAPAAIALYSVWKARHLAAESRGEANVTS